MHTSSHGRAEGSRGSFGQSPHLLYKFFHCWERDAIRVHSKELVNFSVHRPPPGLGHWLPSREVEAWNDSI